jgi:hypothetical protein
MTMPNGRVTEPGGGGVPHLPSDDLIALAGGETASGAQAAHLERCAHCRREIENLRRWLLELRHTALTGADARLTDGHLATQRDHVLRGLALADRSAQIVTFPGARRSVLTRPRAPHRWVAAAAVVGVIAGLSAGRFFHVHPSEISRSTRLIGAPSDAPTFARAITPAEDPSFNDEELLVEIDTALDAPGIAELHAIDALTPTIREASLGPQ